MNLIQKFEYIISWFATNSSESTRQVMTDIDNSKFALIEDIIKEKLPAEFMALYSRYDGEIGKGIGSFFGHAFLSLEEILSNLEFSKSLIKVQRRINPDRVASKRIIHNIVKTSKGDLQGPWHHIEFTCTPNTIFGPYLYESKTTKGRDKLIVNLDNLSKYHIMELCKSLQEIEQHTHNWDELNFTIFHDGIYQIKRIDLSLDTKRRLTSYPINAIRKKYFHLKWLPILSDYGGNFIGIDLDPDLSGKVGQVIVFGRDEAEMFVLADSLEDFLNFIIKEIKSNQDTFLKEAHLHEILKEKVFQKVQKT